MLFRSSLTELQEGIVKIQTAFSTEGEPELPADLQVLHTSRLGRVMTYIVRGRSEAVLKRFSDLNPIFLEALPLTLEEIFIYELGGEDYAVRDILL